MNKGILGIRAEIRITAESETEARSLIDEHLLSRAHCAWRQDPAGHGGHLYIGGELSLDSGTRQFLFIRPADPD